MARFKVSGRIVKSGGSRWFTEAAISLRHPVRLASLVDMDRWVIERCVEHLPGASEVRNYAAPGFESIKPCFTVLNRKRRLRYYSPDRHRGACTLPRVWRL